MAKHHILIDPNKKYCANCKTEKCKSEFHKKSTSCKVCKREYRTKNKEKIVEREKIYYQNNKEEKIKYAIEYYKSNREDILEYKEEYYQDHREDILEYNKQYREDNAEKASEYRKEYYQNHKDDILEYAKIYRENNKYLILENNKKYCKKRRKEDPLFRLRSYASSSITAALKRNGSSKRGESIINFLEYTIDDLKKHIQINFEYWMNWKNWGVFDPKTWDDDDASTWTWQLDHIIPHSAFNYVSMDSQEFRACWALSNLRPLSAKQNLLDGATRARHDE